MNEEKMDIKAAAAKIVQVAHNPAETREGTIDDIRSIGKLLGMTEEEIFDSDMPGDLFSKENRLPKE